MFKLPNEFEHLVDAIKSLPGIGYKSAKKLALFLLDNDQRYIDLFIHKINDAYKNIKRCRECFILTNEEICNICSNKNRDHSKLCIVNSFEDFERIESSNSFFGIYHITTNNINKQSKLLEHKNLLNLKERIIKNPEINEIIIATSFSYDGEMVTQYIVDTLKDFKNIEIYRIGFGVPSNAAIDYVDDDTLNESFINKRKLV